MTKRRSRTSRPTDLKNIPTHLRKSSWMDTLPSIQLAVQLRSTSLASTRLSFFERHSDIFFEDVPFLHRIDCLGNDREG